MPSALLDFLGYAIYFWAGDKDEPIHVHVAKGRPTPDATKFWITNSGVKLANNNSQIPSSDLKKIRKYITEGRSEIITSWIDYFGAGKVKFVED